jgi:SP family general alpha glucoside:H+ symporter-like MFS transporter
MDDDDSKNRDGLVASTETPTATPIADAAGEDRHPGHHNKSHDEIFGNAKSATAKEQNMSLLQGIKLYPKAVAWSMLISTCICMEGYDLCLLSNFYGE